MCGNLRTLVNDQLFEQVAGGLSTTAQTYLERLLLAETPETQLTFTLLKAPPKSAKLSHIEALQVKFDSLMSFGDDNYLSLVWRFYSRYRKLLFRLVRSLDIRSTSQDQSLMDALKFVLSYEHRRTNECQVLGC